MIKNILKNYSAASLLSVCGNFFEKSIFHGMFKFFMENNLILSNQSGYKPGGSCINFLLSIAHKIYISFHRVMMLDLFFLTIWKLFTIFSTMMSCLNWNKWYIWEFLYDFAGLFTWTKGNGSVKQSSLSMVQFYCRRSIGSIFGPMFFFICINNLLKGLHS